MSAYEYLTMVGALIDRIWTTDERVFLNVLNSILSEQLSDVGERTLGRSG